MIDESSGIRIFVYRFLFLNEKLPFTERAVFVY